MIALDDKKVLLVSIAISLIVLVFGMSHLLSQWEYYEKGQGILLGVYAVACFLLFFALRFSKVTQIMSVIALLVLILFYANVKFDWRKEYIENNNSGKPFLLESYIAQYPTLEEHTFGFFWDAPRWVDFANDCVDPALNEQPFSKKCRSNQAVEGAYNINPNELLNAHFKTMKRTAQRIQDGGLTTKKAYQQCLTNKSCAIIPLLPANVDAEEINQQSTDHIKIRRMFWSLINDTQISPEICEFIDLCRALRNSGVTPIPKPDPALPQ